MISFVLEIFFRKMFLEKSLLGKIVYESLTLFLTLVVVYYASESFVLKDNHLEKDQLGLLYFLLIGEVALVIPMSFSQRLLSNLLEIRNQQFYQTLISLRISPIRFGVSKTLVELIFPVLRVLAILICSTLIFNRSFPLSSYFLFYSLQIIASVVMGLMAVLTFSIYLISNRGIGIFYTLQSFAAILGGAYFPINVFPGGIKKLSVIFPQTQVLSTARAIFRIDSFEMTHLFALLGWMILLLILWIVVDRYSSKWLMRKAKLI